MLRIVRAPTHFWLRQTATNTLTSDTAAQKIFSAATNGRLDLPTGVYLFRSLLRITSMSSTSGNADISLAGTATMTRLQMMMGVDNDTITVPVAINGVMTPNANITGNTLTATAASTMHLHWSGCIDVSVAGTVIPSIALTTAAAAVVSIGSFFHAERIGASGVASQGAS